jgi:hypothetical protein
LAVELSDYSVYYSQGISESITAELKNGKSEVVCEEGKLIKISKDKHGVITREVLTKKWTDWVDYWAVEFDYESRKEIIKVAKNLGIEGALPGTADTGEFIDFEERWTGAYIFENEWQSFRTRQSRDLELFSVPHAFEKPGRYTNRCESDRHLWKRHHDARARDCRVTSASTSVNSSDAICPAMKPVNKLPVFALDSSTTWWDLENAMEASVRYQSEHTGKIAPLMLFAPMRSPENLDTWEPLKVLPADLFMVSIERHIDARVLEALKWSHAVVGEVRHADSFPGVAINFELPLADVYQQMDRAGILAYAETRPGKDDPSFFFLRTSEGVKAFADALPEVTT